MVSGPGISMELLAYSFLTPTIVLALLEFKKRKKNPTLEAEERLGDSDADSTSDSGFDDGLRLIDCFLKRKINI